MNFTNIRFEKNIDIKNIYEISKIGSPLSRREIDLIKKSIWKGFFSKLFHSGFVDNILLRKEDWEYYVIFRREVIAVPTLGEVIELIFFEWCMKKGKYKTLRRYIPNCNLLKDQTLKSIVLENLENNKVVFTDMYMTEEDEDVVDLINYIKAYF